MAENNVSQTWGNKMQRHFVVLVLILLALMCPAHLALAGMTAERQAEIQAFLDTLPLENVSSADIEAVLGKAAISVGEQWTEGIRDGKLDALCAADWLAANPIDRTLTMGKVRTTHLYSYGELGLLFVFLDNPWALYEIRLSKPNFSLNNLRVNDPKSTADEQFRFLPIPGGRRDGICIAHWNTTSVHWSCRTPVSPSLIEQIVIRNPTYPRSCGLQFRGMYE